MKSEKYEAPFSNKITKSLCTYDQIAVVVDTFLVLTFSLEVERTLSLQKGFNLIEIGRDVFFNSKSW